MEDDDEGDDDDDDRNDMISLDSLGFLMRNIPGRNLAVFESVAIS